MMDLTPPPVDPATARHVLEAAGVRASRALVLFPALCAQTARHLAEALEALGSEVRLRLVEDARYAEGSREEAAALWVPAPAPELEPLLVLYGGQPWEEPFEEDWRLGIEAMEHREALKAAGHHLIFFEWPRGARRDAEVDLRPRAMATIFERALDIDYGAMRRDNARLGAQLEGAERVELCCPHGTDVQLSVASRRFLAEDCVLGPEEPAVYLPGGEIYAPALEDSAEGVVAFRFVGEPHLARFVGGLCVGVERADGRPSPELGDELGVGIEPLCELGIGTNPWAPPWQIGTLYEKSAGTVHVAVGGNAHFGGARDSPRHADLIVRDPELVVDGRRIELPRARWRQFSPGGYRAP